MNKFNKIIIKTIHSEGLRSSAVVTIGNVGGSAIAAIALIIISRKMGPTIFGNFSALLSLLLILAKVGDLGMNLAMQRYLATQSHNTRSTMTKSVLVAKLILTAILILIGLVAAPVIDDRFIHIGSTSTIRLTFIATAGVIYYEYAISVIQAFHKFFLYSLTVFTQAILKIIGVFILIATSSLFPLNTTILYGISPFLTATIFNSKTKVPLLGKTLFHPAIKQDLLKLLPVARWTGIAVISTALAENIDIIIIQSLLDSKATGLFSASARIATFVSLIGISVGAVLNIRVARYKSKKNLDTYLRKAKKYAIFILLAILVLIPFGRILLLLTAGPKYVEGLRTLTLLLGSTAFTAATSPFASLFFLFDKPQYFALSGLLMTVLLIVCDFFLIPSLGIYGAGMARLITRIGVLTFTIIYARVAYKEKYST